MITSFLITSLSLIAFSLTDQRHQKLVFANAYSSRQNNTRWYKVTAYTGLLLSCWLACSSYGIALGLVYWFAGITLAALLIAMVLSYKPQGLIFISLFCGLSLLIALLSKLTNG